MTSAEWWQWMVLCSLLIQGCKYGVLLVSELDFHCVRIVEQGQASVESWRDVLMEQKLQKSASDLKMLISM